MNCCKQFHATKCRMHPTLARNRQKEGVEVLTCFLYSSPLFLLRTVMSLLARAITLFFCTILAIAGLSAADDLRANIVLISLKLLLMMCCVVML